MSKRETLPDSPARTAGDHRAAAFTLLELLMVIGIIAVLATMMFPATQNTMEYARNARCLANLRQIGLAAILSTQDRDNTFPYIEANPKDPVYDADKNAKGLLETLAPYGLTEATLKCPEDLAGPNAFAAYGSSYQWLNYADGEKTWSIKIVTPEGEIEHPPSSVRLAVDWFNVHFSGGQSKPEETSGKRNAVYADGHVGVSGG